MFETQSSQHTEQGWLQDTKLKCFLHISWVAKDQSAVPSSWQRFQISSFQSVPEASLPVPVESGTTYCARLVESREKGTPVLDIAVYVLSMSFSLGPNCPFHPSARWEFACILLYNHAHTVSQPEMKVSEEGSTQDSKSSREGWMSGTFSALFPSYHQTAIMYLSKGICVPPTSPNNFWWFLHSSLPQDLWKVEVSDIITRVWVLQPRTTYTILRKCSIGKESSLQRCPVNVFLSGKSLMKIHFLSS